MLKSGEFKDVGSPHREMTSRERELMMELLLDIQTQFVKAVAQGRDLELSEVEKIADGRVFSGAKGKELGLVDQLGNFQDAVDLTKRMAHIGGKVTLVYPEKPSGSWLDLFVESVTRGVARAAGEALRSRVDYRWDGWRNITP